MSWLSDILSPINKALNSTPFKAMFPVQGLAQGATKALTGMDPAQQYMTGASVGSGLAGLRGLGLIGGSGLTPYSPTSTPIMDSAGLTTGPGGAFSKLNPMGSALQAPVGRSNNLLSALKLLRARSDKMQSQQANPAMQQQEQQRRLQMIYSMFPNLRPGGFNG